MMAIVLAVFLMISVLAFSIFSVVQFVDGYLDRNTHGMIFWGLMVLIMRTVYGECVSCVFDDFGISFFDLFSCAICGWLPRQKHTRDDFLGLDGFDHADGVNNNEDQRRR